MYTARRGNALDCRFFPQTQAFVESVSIHRSPLGSHVLPQLLFAAENAQGTLRSSTGFAYPFVVQERGLTVTEWVAQPKPRTGLEVVALVEALAGLLAQVHAHGQVHTQLQPGNVVYLIHSTSWRMRNVCSAVQAGAPPCRAKLT